MILHTSRSVISLHSTIRLGYESCTQALFLNKIVCCLIAINGFTTTYPHTFRNLERRIVLATHSYLLQSLMIGCFDLTGIQYQVMKLKLNPFSNYGKTDPASDFVIKYLLIFIYFYSDGGNRMPGPRCPVDEPWCFNSGPSSFNTRGTTIGWCTECSNIKCYYMF